MGKSARDLWFDVSLIAFFTLILIGLLEGLFRVLPLNKSSKTDAPSLAWEDISLSGSKRIESDAYKPYVAWAHDFFDYDSSQKIGILYEPYSLWKTSPTLANPYRNFNENGYRVTPQPSTLSCEKLINVAYYGGSTMAGDGLLRDKDLIPHLTALIYSSKSDDNTCLDSTNWGQSGFSSGNEFTLFFRNLLDGERPDYAIFFDGFNDSVQQGIFDTPHMAYSKFKSVWLDNHSSSRNLIQLLASKSRLISFFNSPSDSSEDNADLSRQAVQARSIAAAQSYVQHSHALSQICRAFDVTCVFLLQPSLFSKASPSLEEQDLLSITDMHIPQMRVAVNQFGDSAVATASNRTIADPAYILHDLRDAYASNNRSFYVDAIHVSPGGNEIISRNIADIIYSLQTR